MLNTIGDDPHCPESCCTDFSLCKLLVDAGRPDLCTKRFVEEEAHLGYIKHVYLIGEGLEKNDSK